MFADRHASLCFQMLMNVVQVAMFAMVMPAAQTQTVLTLAHVTPDLQEMGHLVQVGHIFESINFMRFSSYRSDRL